MRDFDFTAASSWLSSSVIGQHHHLGLYGDAIMVIKLYMNILTLVSCIDIGAIRYQSGGAWRGLEAGLLIFQDGFTFDLLEQ